MSLGKYDTKLNSFFDSIKKTASLGNFSHLKTPESIGKEAKMLNEMVMLPKYNDIVSKLKGSIGLVNVVTHDGYRPLVEIMLLKAFPSTHNEIRKPESLSEDSFISSEWFVPNPIQGDTDQIKASRAKLQDFVLGTKAKTTRDWLRQTMKMGNDQINDYLGGDENFWNKWIDQIEKANAQAAKDAGLPPGQVNWAAIPCPNPRGRDEALYTRALKAIEDKFSRKIELLSKKIDDHFSGKKEVKPTTELDPTVYDLKEQRDMWLVQRNDALSNLNGDIGERLTFTRPGGIVVRNKDGLANAGFKNVALDISATLWRTANERETGSDNKEQQYVDLLARQKKILTIANSLKVALEEYKTTNPRINEAIKGMLDLLGQTDSTDLAVQNKVYSNIVGKINGQFARARKNLLDAVKGENAVAIFNDVDKTAFASKDKEGKLYLDKGAMGILTDFAAGNDANLVMGDSKVLDVDPKSKSKQKTDSSNRIVVLISTDPIANLPNATVVDMQVSPVDSEEAEIIVRNVLGAYLANAKSDLKNRLIIQLDEDIEEKVNNKKLTWNDAQAAKTKALSVIQEQIKTVYSNFGDIDEDIKKSMVNSIQGLTAAAAIKVVRESLAASRLKLEEEDLTQSKIEGFRLFDEKFLKQDFSQRVGDILEVETLGLTDINIGVKWEDYSYRTGKDSPWGMKVPQIGLVGQSLKRIKDQINANKKAISKIDMQLNLSLKANANDPNRLSQDAVTKLYAQKQGLMKTNEHLSLRMDISLSHSLPHLIILWGRPGTGKSVFPEALADLMGLRMKSVDCSAQESKWVGETAQNTTKLLNTMRGSKDMVFLFDEIDKQMSSGKGDQESMHHVTKQMIGKFLEYFADPSNEAIFKKNNVYFVMTTNFVNSINEALVNRGNVFEVKLPKEAKDYLKFFRSNFAVERRRNPKPPIMGDGDLTYEDGWKTTNEFIARLDWERIARNFAARANEGPEKEVDFRLLMLMLREMWNQETSYRESLESIDIWSKSSKDPEKPAPQIVGVPVTTENFLSAIDRVSTSMGGNENVNRGFLDLATEKCDDVNKMLQPYLDGKKQWETEEYKDAFTGETKTRVKLPSEAEEFIRGKPVPEGEKTEEEEESEFIREIDPATGRMKTRVKSKTPTQEMKELGEGGFTEKPVSPEDEVVLEDMPPSKKPGDKDKSKDPKKDKVIDQSGTGMEAGQSTKAKEGIKSSTDYLFNYLFKKGLIDGSGKFVSPPKTAQKVNAAPAPVVGPRQKKFNPITENSGPSSWDYGFTLIMPKD